MAKKGARELVAIICKECKSQNYVTERNKINIQTKNPGATGKLEVKKFCKKCKKATPHKESTKLK